MQMIHFNTGFTANEDNVDIIVVGGSNDARRCVLKNPKSYGPLAGDADNFYAYTAESFKDFLNRTAGATEGEGVDILQVESLMANADLVFGTVTVFFTVKGTVYFISGGGIEYFAKEAL